MLAKLFRILVFGRHFRDSTRLVATCRAIGYVLGSVVRWVIRRQFVLHVTAVDAVASGRRLFFEPVGVDVLARRVGVDGC